MKGLNGQLVMPTFRWSPSELPHILPSAQINNFCSKCSPRGFVYGEQPSLTLGTTLNFHNLVRCSCFLMSGITNQSHGGEVWPGSGTSWALLVAMNFVVTVCTCVVVVQHESTKTSSEALAARSRKPDADSGALSRLPSCALVQTGHSNKTPSIPS